MSRTCSSFSSSARSPTAPSSFGQTPQPPPPPATPSFSLKTAKTNWVSSSFSFSPDVAVARQTLSSLRQTLQSLYDQLVSSPQQVFSLLFHHLVSSTSHRHVRGPDLALLPRHRLHPASQRPCCKRQRLPSQLSLRSSRGSLQLSRATRAAAHPSSLQAESYGRNRRELARRPRWRSRRR